MPARLVTRLCLALTLLTCLATTAGAHYLWVVLDGRAGEQGTAHVYFEGGPSPGDGQYLDPFIKRGTTWIRTSKDPAGKKLDMQVSRKPGKRWLSTSLPTGGPRSIDSYGKWGVYRYGKTDVLLHYYARYLDVKNPAELAKLSRAKQQAFDIAPKQVEGEFQAHLTWKDEPAANRTVVVRGPGGFRQNVKTNAQGLFKFRPKTPGVYRLLTNIEFKHDGKFEGKTYQVKRHHASMLIRLPLNEAAE